MDYKRIEGLLSIKTVSGRLLHFGKDKKQCKWNYRYKTLLMEKQLISLNAKNIKAIKNERNPIIVLKRKENLWHC